MRKGWIVTIAALLLLVGGCARDKPVQRRTDSSKRAAKKRAAKPAKKPAPRLPRWYSARVLSSALADLSGLDLTGIWSVQLRYKQGADTLIYYLDLQSRQGQLETVAVRETAPIPASAFVSADWRGQWVVVQPGQAHARWPVAALEDLSMVWPVLQAPQLLALLVHQKGEPSQLRGGRVQVQYARHRLTLKQGRIVSLADQQGGRPIQLSWAGEALTLTRGGTQVVLKKVRARWAIDRVTFKPARLSRGFGQINNWRRAGTALRGQDPYRAALIAYRQARQRGVGVDAAVNRLVALFGKWAEREIIR